MTNLVFTHAFAVFFHRSVPALPRLVGIREGIDLGVSRLYQDTQQHGTVQELYSSLTRPGIGQTSCSKVFWYVSRGSPKGDTLMSLYSFLESVSYLKARKTCSFGEGNPQSEHPRGLNTAQSLYLEDLRGCPSRLPAYRAEMIEMAHGHALCLKSHLQPLGFNQEVQQKFLAFLKFLAAQETPLSELKQLLQSVKRHCYKISCFLLLLQHEPIMHSRKWIQLCLFELLSHIVWTGGDYDISCFFRTNQHQTCTA